MVEAGDDVRLLARVTWQEGRREARPVLVIVHGLGGCDAAGYAVATGRLALERGWHVARMNMRGAGDAEAPVPAPLQRGPRRRPAGRPGRAGPARAGALAVVGFSLGANLALLALARGGDRLPAGLAARGRRLAAAGPRRLRGRARAPGEPALPVVLRPQPQGGLPPASATAARPLRAGARARPPHHPRVRRRRSPRPTADTRARTSTTPRSSAGPSARRARPAPRSSWPPLDDPMVPADSVARWPLPPSGLVRREMTSTGGHVGFVAPTSRARPFLGGGARAGLRDGRPRLA